MLIDIDNFKQVNDLHGHAAGDKLLEALSTLLREVLPADALAARLGGDEFVILLQDVREEQVAHLGEQLRMAFSHVARKGVATPEAVSLSVGVSLYTKPALALENLMALADAALYDAKRAGRDRLIVSPAHLTAANP